jgi:hypothetical protein
MKLGKWKKKSWWTFSFCCCCVFKKSWALKLGWDFLVCCVFKVQKKSNVRAQKFGRKLQRKLGKKTYKVSCRLNLIPTIAHAYALIHLYYCSWKCFSSSLLFVTRFQLRFFPCVVCKLMMMATTSFMMIGQWSSLFMICSFCICSWSCFH